MEKMLVKEECMYGKNACQKSVSKKNVCMEKKAVKNSHQKRSYVWKIFTAVIMNRLSELCNFPTRMTNELNRIKQYLWYKTNYLY
jgi:hypothetical protein